MCTLEAYKIDLKGLEEESKTFRFSLDESFFEAIEAPDVQHGKLDCELVVIHTSTHFELRFHTKGVVQLICDRCLGDMEQSIDTEDRLVVKFGTQYSEEDDLVTIVEDEGILDVSWFIYEFIALNIPLQHVHAPGKCDPAMEKLLKEHTATRSDGKDDEKSIDPRWSKLADLFDDNKK